MFLPLSTNSHIRFNPSEQVFQLKKVTINFNVNSLRLHKIAVNGNFRVLILIGSFDGTAVTN